MNWRFLLIINKGLRLNFMGKGFIHKKEAIEGFFGEGGSPYFQEEK
jgi:hypothetical protein